MTAYIRDVDFLDDSGMGFGVDQDVTEGWDDSVDVRVTQTDLPNGHGQFDLPVFRSGRMFTVGGLVRARSGPEMENLRDRLTGLLADGSADVFTWDKGGRRQWARVKLGGPPKFKHVAYGLTAQYQITFWAPDPRKYGRVRSVDSGEPMFHAGNFPALPEYTLTGSMPAGYSLHTTGGQYFTVTKPLMPSDVHQLSMRDGRLYVNGVLATGDVTRGDIWTVPPGARVITTLEPVSGVGRLTGRVTDTWI